MTTRNVKVPLVLLFLVLFVVLYETHQHQSINCLEIILTNCSHINRPKQCFDCCMMSDYANQTLYWYIDDHIGACECRDIRSELA